jgi:hypothetical protein
VSLGRDLRTQVFDHTKGLVTHDPGISGSLPSSAEYAQIRATKTHATDANHKLARARLRVGNIVDHDPAGLDEQGGFHAAGSSNRRGLLTIIWVIKSGDTPAARSMGRMRV